MPIPRASALFCRAFVLSALAILVCACNRSSRIHNITRPALAPAYSESANTTAVEGSVQPGGPNDPDLCDKADPTDPLGGLSSRSVYKFASAPKVQNLYARLVMFTKVCTDKSLSSKDKTALNKILDFLKITGSKSFSAAITITGDSHGGVKYPQMIPFSYSYDEAKSTYSVQTIGKAVIPWQVVDAFDVQYSYTASKNVAVNTASLFSDITTAVAGAGGSSTLLSPAAKTYLAAGQAVLQNVAQSFLTAINNASDSYRLDVIGGPERAITYRFTDLSGRPLASVRLVVAFTNSIQNPQLIDPMGTDSTVPQFSELQDILGVSIGGPLMGTLRDAVSKETSYQDLLKSTPDTTAQSFTSSCDNLERSLQATYGLNRYDAALAMGQILSQNTLYLYSKKFYDSGCFRSRAVLKTMGIDVFEKAPTS